jgi:hypothetical protein
MRDVVRLEERLLSAVARSMADEVRVGETGRSGSDLDGDAAGIVEDTPLESPAIGGPDPVGERVVDEGGPARPKRCKVSCEKGDS